MTLRTYIRKEGGIEQVENSIEQDGSISKFIACPFCGEQIHKKAAICKYCGNNVKKYFKKIKMVEYFTNTKSFFADSASRFGNFIRNNKIMSVASTLLLIIFLISIFYGVPKYKNHISEKRKNEKIAREMKVTSLADYISLTKTGYDYNISSYKNPDSVYYTHEGNTTYRHESKGSYQTKIYGVTIKGFISNDFVYRTVKAKVTIRAVTERKEYGLWLGRETWGGKTINDSFIVEVPPSGIGFSKYYDLTTGIKGIMPLDSRRGTYLKSSPDITLQFLLY